MERIVRIPEDDLILVCDSRKALLLKNTGPTAKPKLVITGHIEADDSVQDRLDADRPGRRSDGKRASASGGPRSAMETRDVGEVLAASFAKSLAEHLSTVHRKWPFATLLIVAPPSFLGLLRPELNDEIPNVPTKEVHKHLTELPISELQRALLDLLG